MSVPFEVMVNKDENDGPRIDADKHGLFVLLVLFEPLW